MCALRDTRRLCLPPASAVSWLVLAACATPVPPIGQPCTDSGRCPVTQTCEPRTNTCQLTSTLITHLDIGYEHGCVVLQDQSVRCWGGNDNGELGYGNSLTIGDDEPASVGGLVPVGGNVAQISAGEAHTCALLTDGRVRCWGSGRMNRLGNGRPESIGDNEFPSTAPDVDIGGTALQIATSALHSCVVLDTGAVRCWGAFTRGQLGYPGETDDTKTAAQLGSVEVGGPATRVAVGGSFTCALLRTGEVRCWGDSDSGRLGTGAPLQDIGDDELPTSNPVVDLQGGAAADIALGRAHACVLLTTGAVRCWGDASLGQIGHGDDSPVLDAANAVDVALRDRAEQIAAGYNHNCALLVDRTIQCWGTGSNPDGGNGILGYGSFNCSRNDGCTNLGDDETLAGLSVVDVGGAAIAIAAGRDSTCALLGGPAPAMLGAGDATAGWATATLRTWETTSFPKKKATSRYSEPRTEPASFVTTRHQPKENKPLAPLTHVARRNCFRLALFGVLSNHSSED